MAGEAGLDARRLALDALGRVLLQGQSLDSWQPAGAPAERAFALRAATTVLRRKGELDRALDRFLTSPLPKSSGSTRQILLLAAAELTHLRTPPHAAINSAVALAKADRDARHFSGLINAVLRKLSTAPALEAEPQANTPDWLFARWAAHYGPERARSIAAAHAREPAIDLSVKRDAATWAERLKGTLLPGGSIRLPPEAGAISALPGFAEGAWWVQDWAAAQPARLFGDVRGQTILDLCAAPGGKTVALAAAGAEVTAVDSSAARLARVEENLKRLGLAAQIVGADIRSWQPPHLYDGVLLDAPCSATGTIRRHPDLPYLKTEKQIAELARLQAEFLKRAAQWVKPGGLLVYSTCSLEPEECIERADAFLDDHPDFRRSAIAPEEVGGAAEVLTAAGDFRSLPDMDLSASTGMDGFYACRLVRGP